MSVENEYKINVKVGGKVYKMTVKSHEETFIRTAAEKVTKMYEQYSDKLPNTVDRMAIVALQMAVKSEERKAEEKLDEVVDNLNDICDSIDKALLEDTDNIELK